MPSPPLKTTPIEVGIAAAQAPMSSGLIVTLLSMLLGVLALADVQGIWAIMVPHAIFMIARGIHQPCGQAGAVGPFPQAAGAASALNGFLIMAVAFVMGGWLGSHMDGTISPMTNGIWFWSVVLAITAWTAVRKYGDPLQAPLAAI